MTRAVIEGYFRAYNAECPEALKGYYHPDVELHSAEGVLRGPAEILAVYRQICSQFRDHMTPLAIVEQGEAWQVDILDHFTARTAVSNFMGRAFAAGDELTLPLRAHYRLCGGRILRADIALRPEA